MNERQLELLKVLKRRSYPLAFKDDATNEDIVHVMEGKLARPVFLRLPPSKEAVKGESSEGDSGASMFSYPHVVFS